MAKEHRYQHTNHHRFDITPLDPSDGVQVVDRHEKDATKAGFTLDPMTYKVFKLCTNQGEHEILPRLRSQGFPRANPKELHKALAVLEAFGLIH